MNHPQQSRFEPVATPVHATMMSVRHTPPERSPRTPDFPRSPASHREKTPEPTSDPASPIKRAVLPKEAHPAYSRAPVDSDAASLLDSMRNQARQVAGQSHVPRHPRQEPEQEPVSCAKACFGDSEKPSYDEHEVALVMTKRRPLVNCENLADPDDMSTLYTWEPRDGQPKFSKPQSVPCRSVGSRRAGGIMQVRNSHVHRVSLSRNGVKKSQALLSSRSDMSTGRILRLGAYATQYTSYFKDWDIMNPKTSTGDYCIDYFIDRCTGEHRISRPCCMCCK